MKLYHYTIADRLVKILIDGYLKLTPSEVYEEGEWRAVWFTSNPNWDNTAFFGYPKEVLDSAGRIRITVSSDELFNKAEAEKHRLGDWDALTNSAQRVGVTYKEWYVTFMEVGFKNFMCIELWKDERWVKVPLNPMLGES